MRTLSSVVSRFAKTGVVTGLLLTASACQSTSQGGTSKTTIEYRALYSQCIDAHGGQGMDAVDLYAGRLSSACSQWAYRRVRR